MPVPVPFQGNMKSQWDHVGVLTWQVKKKRVKEKTSYKGELPLKKIIIFPVTLARSELSTSYDNAINSHQQVLTQLNSLHASRQCDLL